MLSGLVLRYDWGSHELKLEFHNNGYEVGFVLFGPGQTFGL